MKTDLDYMNVDSLFGKMYEEPDTVDMADLRSIYEDEDIYKKKTANASRKPSSFFGTAIDLLYPETGESNASRQHDSGASNTATTQNLGETGQYTTSEPKSILNAPRSFMDKAIEWIGSSYIKSTLIIGALFGSCILLKRFLQGKLAFNR